MSRNANVDVIQTLLKHFANEHVSIDGLVSPDALREYLENSANSDLVAVLLDSGWNSTQTIGSHGTLLHYAVLWDRETLVETICASNQVELDSTNETDGTPLNIATSRGIKINHTIVKTLLEKGADPNKHSARWRAPLHAAADAGNLETVELLLEYQAKLDVLSGPFGTPLHGAVFSRDEKTFSALLERAKPTLTPKSLDIGGRLPLHIAAAVDNKDAWEVLSGQGGAGLCDSDFQGRTALHFASGNGSMDVATAILDACPEAINGKDLDGWTALHWACRQSNVQMISLLLKKGANVEASSERGWKPVDVTTYYSLAFEVPDLEEAMKLVEVPVSELALSSRSGTEVPQGDDLEPIPATAAMRSMSATDPNFMYICDSCLCVSEPAPILPLLRSLEGRLEAHEVKPLT